MGVEYVDILHIFWRGPC